MANTVKTIREAGYSDIKILVGGAPVTDKYAQEIGANGYARDAASAVDTARQAIA